MNKFAGGLSARQVALCALAAVAAPAFSQAIPTTVRLTFTQPSAVVSATASIPVMVTVTNTSSTQPFVLNNTGPTFGLNPAQFPTTGSYFDPVLNQSVTAAFVSYSQVSYTNGFSCSGTFTTVANCTAGPPYTFTFGTVPLTFSLAPLASTSYLFGTFAPSAGPVAPGTYSFYGAIPALNFSGLDSAGHTLNQFNYYFSSGTCSGLSDASCGAAGLAFTRTVVAVPEPATWGLMALGIGALLARQRRRTA